MVALTAKPLTAKPLTAKTLIARALGAGEVVSEPAYSPTSLFASNEEGAFYDFSNLATLRQNSDGTTAVVDYGDPVGFVLDQSKGSSTLTDNLGPEIINSPSTQLEKSGAGSADATWDGTTFTVPVDSGSAFSPRIRLVNSNVLTVGKFYQLDLTLSDISNIALIDIGGVRINNALSTSLIFQCEDANNTATYISTDGTNAPFSVDITLSIRELPGNHLTQSTSTARPLLARVPVGGRRNVANSSIDFDNFYDSSSPNKGRVTLTEGVEVSPNGTTAWDLTCSATSALEARARYTTSLDASTEYTLSIVAKIDDTARLYLRILAVGGSNNTSVFDLSNGTVITAGSDYTDTSISDEGDGWYRCSITGTTVGLNCH